jgi:carbonic anhydrase
LGFDAVVAASDPSKNQQTISVALDTFIPKANRGWSYSGSKTTPPCEEGVRWFVFADTVAFSPAQVAEFRKDYPNNARPIMQSSGWVFDILHNPAVDLSH